MKFELINNKRYFSSIDLAKDLNLTLDIITNKIKDLNHFITYIPNEIIYEEGYSQMDFLLPEDTLLLLLMNLQIKKENIIEIQLKYINTILF